MNGSAAWRRELEAKATNKAAEQVKKPVEPDDERRPDDPCLPPSDTKYRMMRLVHGNRTAKRLRLRPAEGIGDNAKWAFIMNLQDDLERKSSTVPQVIVLVTNIGTFRIEGYGLEEPGGLYDMLDEERVREVAAYCPQRHGPDMPVPPYVSAIVFMLEGQTAPEVRDGEPGTDDDRSAAPM